MKRTVKICICCLDKSKNQLQKEIAASSSATRHMGFSSNHVSSSSANDQFSQYMNSLGAPMPNTAVGKGVSSGTNVALSYAQHLQEKINQSSLQLGACSSSSGIASSAASTKRRTQSLSSLPTSSVNRKVCSMTTKPQQLFCFHSRPIPVFNESALLNSHGFLMFEFGG